MLYSCTRMATVGVKGSCFAGDRCLYYCRFLMSFVVDARGAAVSARRRPGLRIRVPPEAACMPTRVTCRIARRYRDGGRRQPRLSVGDGLATHVLEMGPVGEQFTRCLLQCFVTMMTKQIFSRRNIPTTHYLSAHPFIYGWLF